MTAPEQKSPSRGARIAAVLLIGLLGLFVLAQAGSSTTTAVVSVRDEAPTGTTDPDTVTHPGAPPAADLAALLNGLSLGNEFDGWKVVSFIPTKDKIAWIEFGKDQTFFAVGIGVKGKGNPPPPIQTELYEVGYGLVRPKGATIPPDVPTRIAEQVASRIRMREKEVARPMGL